jgi:hypothetical protein
VKLCEDCRWCRYDRSYPERSKCEHLQGRHKTMVDYVTGRQAEGRPRDCNIVRDDEGLCGPDARYWEQRTD